ncbi:MAG: FG-GAP repeat domain-containing protein [Bacillota bacterium]
MKLKFASVIGLCIGWAVSQAAFADPINPCSGIVVGPIVISGGGVVICSDPCTGGTTTAGGSSTTVDTAVTYPGSDLVFSVVDNGDGTFGFSFSNPSNLDLSYITSVTIDDVDGDGFPDLILGVNSSATGGAGVQVLMNDGTGSGIVVYQATLATGASSSPASVLTADVNGDGWDDIVTADGSADSVSVFVNNGDGTFAPAVSYPTGGNTGNLVSQDLNNDGMPDLFLNSSGSLTILLNNGDGTFAPAATYAGGDFSTVTTGDLVGDGEADLILYGGTSGVGVMLAHGDGTYAPVAWTQVPADAIDIDDFNNDGVPDLAAVSTAGGTVTVLLGHGDGTFGTPASYAVGVGPADVWSFDENGDGWEDIVTDNNDGTQSLLLNNGDGSFAPAQAYTPPPINVCFFMAPGALAAGTGAQVQFKGGNMIMQGLKQDHRLGEPASTAHSAGSSGGLGDIDLLCLALLAGLTALRRRR